VICRSGGLDLCLVIDGPIGQSADMTNQRKAHVSQTAFDRRRSCFEDFAAYKTVSFKTTKCNGQHPLRDSVNSSQQCPKSLWTASEAQDDEHAPFVPHSA